MELHTEDLPSLLDEHGPIFIAGCPRSGTTFLSHCLDAIPAIDTYVGRILPPRFMHEVGRRDVAGEDSGMMMQIARDILWLNFLRRNQNLEERLGYSIRKPARLKNLLNRGRINGRLLCYKEPFLGWAIGPFAAEFTGAKFIHIVRDGRDNADSLVRSYPNALSDKVLRDPALATQNNSEIGTFTMQAGIAVPWWVRDGDVDHFIGGSQFIRSVVMWNEIERRAMAALDGFGPDRGLRIRYEDLADPGYDLPKRICDFLGRETPSSLRRYSQKAHATSVGIHRDRHSASELDLAWSIAGETLTDLGYTQ